MRLLIITQVVDSTDPILGFFHRWIEEFAKQHESVTVICLKEGKHALPANVRVLSLGKERGVVSRSRYAYRFLKTLFSLRSQYDSVFVHMNPEYILLAGLLWRIFGKRIVLWYTHKSVTLTLRVATFFAHAVCTASPESFRLASSKVRVVGHGIGTDFFKADPRVVRMPHALSAGRLMYTKRHDLAIRKAYADGRELHIAGSGPEQASLEALARQLGAKAVFLGPLTQQEMRSEYRQAAYFIHTSETGSLDKVVLEALACGLPVRTDDPALKHLESKDSEYVRAHHSLQALVPRLAGILSGTRPSVAYLFTGTDRRQVLAQAEQGEMPDSAFMGLNYLEQLGADVTLVDSGAVTPRPWLAKYVPVLDRLRGTLALAWHCRAYDAVVTSNRLQVGVILRFLYFLFLRPHGARFLYVAIDTSVVLRRGAGLFQRLAFRCVDIFICITTQQIRDLEAAGIPAARLHFAQYGIDISWWQQLGAPLKGEYILGVGADAARDWKLFMDVAREMDQPFVIATTPGSILPEPVPPNVRVLRGQGPREVRELYRRASTVFLAVHDDEFEKGSDCSGQTVMLEAMAVGVPVVMTRKVWQADYVEEDKDAVVVAPGDIEAAVRALKSYLSGADTSGWAQRVLHAQNTVSKFTSEALGKSIFAAIKGTSQSSAPLTVCVFGIYDPLYARNQVLLKGLRENGVRVIECRMEPKAPGRYWALARALRAAAPQCDVLLAMYPAPTPTILARLLWLGKPLVTDAFVSMFDAVVNDRQQFGRYHPKALRLLVLDWVSVWLSDLALVDTAVHMGYWRTWPGLKRHPFAVIPVGSDPELLQTSDVLPPHKTVTYHGSYIPLQGLSTVVRAFALLKGEQDISFRMVGEGQEFAKSQALIKELGIEDRIETIRRVPFASIPAYISATDIVMGIFGATDKAQRVVPNKVYEGLAAGKAVISMDTPALREMFGEGEVYRTAGTPEALAAAIKALVRDPELRARYAKSGYEVLRKLYAPRPLGRLLADVLRSTLKH